VPGVTPEPTLYGLAVNRDFQVLKTQMLCFSPDESSYSSGFFRD
jgi:hypothetical protein